MILQANLMIHRRLQRVQHKQTRKIHNPSDLRSLTDLAAKALSYAIATEQHGEGPRARSP